MRHSTNNTGAAAVSGIHRVSEQINDYGDTPLRASKVCGTDISSVRFDDLDRFCLGWVNTHGSEVKGVDIGCGLARPSITMALMGATMIGVDILDLEQYFNNIVEDFPGLQFEYRHEDALEFLLEGDEVNFLYSQRCLHYLPFDQAVSVLERSRNYVKNSGWYFLSFSGLNSELGQNYHDASLSVSERFCKLSNEMQSKHEIYLPVCLYTENDVRELAHEVGLRVDQIWRSDFGNIKAILQAI